MKTLKTSRRVVRLLKVIQVSRQTSKWLTLKTTPLLVFQHSVFFQNLSEFQNLATFQSTTAKIQSGVLLDFAAATLFGFKAGGQAVQLLNQTFDKKTSWPILLLLLLLLHAFGEFKIKFNLMFESTKEDRNLCCI